MQSTYPPIFVISLPGTDERRSYISEQLGKLGLPFSFFDAVNGYELDVLSHENYNGKKRRLLFGKDLTQGELGCFLSHKKIYQKICNDNLESAVILEDDVILHEDFPKILSTLSKHQDHFDLVRFLGSPKVMKRGGRKLIPLNDPYWLIRMPTAPGGAHATLVTQNGAQKLLHSMQRTAYPIDTLLGRGWETGVEALAVHPGLATQELSFANTIGNDRFDKTLQLAGFERLAFPFTRGWFKISEAIGKKWLYWSNIHQDQKVKTHYLHSA